MTDDPDAEVPGEYMAEEAFAALGNETRLAILQALWEVTVPGDADPTSGSLTFSELHERVGVADSGQFNYHLNRLVGRFVRQTEAGYTLRSAGEAVVRAVIKGTLTGETTLDGAAVEEVCPHCGAGVVLDYRDDMLYVRCSSCEGSYRYEGRPEGTLTGFPLPPVALLNRTPEEIFWHGTIWSEHVNLTFMRGSCPECAGLVETTAEVCDDHDPGEGRVCDACGSIHGVKYFHVCTVCKRAARISAWVHAFTSARVAATFERNGFDSLGPGYFHIWHETVEGTEITGRDPLEVTVAFDVRGDRLSVRLDETGGVLAVEEGS